MPRKASSHHRGRGPAASIDESDKTERFFKIHGVSNAGRWRGREQALAIAARYAD